MSQALDSELHGYIDKLSYEQKASLLSMIRSFFSKSIDKQTNVAQYNAEIDESMRRMNNNEGIAHEDIEREAEQW